MVKLRRVTIRRKRVLLRRKLKRKGFNPRWTGRIEGWTKKYIRQNHWRVKRSFTKLELLQEAKLIFHKLTIKYDYVDSPSWFMGLYKTSLHNKFISWSSQETKKRKMESTFSEVFEYYEHYQTLSEGMEWNGGYIEVLIDQAPQEVRSVVHLMLYCPKELMCQLSDMWSSRGKKKMHGNEFLCAVLGYDDKEIDLVKMTKDYFS